MFRVFSALLVNIVVAGALTTGSTAADLHDAVRAHDAGKVQSILDAGGPIDDSDFILGTALHVAIAEGDTEIVGLLLDGGADIEATSELQGARPLHLAADLGEQGIASELLGRGAAIDSRDGNDATPLHRAAAVGHASVVELLLDAGADPHLTDGKTGGTPLHYAAQNGNLEASKTLLRHGAPINAIDAVGYTPLWLAAGPPSFDKVGDASLMEFLVSNGANLDVRDKAGLTLLEYTRVRGASFPAWRPIADALERLSSTK